MKLRTRPKFYRDLAREQLRLLNKAGPEIAEAWTREVRHTIEFLLSWPLVGRERKDLKHPGIHSWRVSRFGRWIIFYGVRDDVLILHRIIYATMDLTRVEI